MKDVFLIITLTYRNVAKNITTVIDTIFFFYVVEQYFSWNTKNDSYCSDSFIIDKIHTRMIFQKVFWICTGAAPPAINILNIIICLVF